MAGYSTNEAAARLGISGKALSRYIQNGKVPPPRIIETGKASLHVWTEEEIEHVRKLLPKIANGRKTRYEKLREKQKAQAGVPVPHNKRKPTKKK
jgi:predicted site-specific integrase-resolvase